MHKQYYYYSDDVHSILYTFFTQTGDFILSIITFLARVVKKRSKLYGNL